MPIRPSLRELYPSDWPEISRRIRFERAGGRCEACGRPHLWTVYCLPDGRWHDAEAGCWRDGQGNALVGEPARGEPSVGIVFVVLTCAHIDHDPANNCDDNLAAWCQRCHLIHDATHHQVQRRITVRARSALADLFAGIYSLVGYPRNAG